MWISNDLYTMFWIYLEKMCFFIYVFYAAQWLASYFVELLWMQSSIYFVQFSYADAMGFFFLHSSAIVVIVVVVKPIIRPQSLPPIGTFVFLPLLLTLWHFFLFSSRTYFLIQFRKLLHNSLNDILDNGNSTNGSTLNTTQLSFNVKDWIQIQTLNIAYLCSAYTHPV